MGGIEERRVAGSSSGPIRRVAADRNLEYQQNLKALPLSVAVLIAQTNKLEDLKPLVPHLLTRLASLAANTLVRIGG